MQRNVRCASPIEKFSFAAIWKEKEYCILSFLDHVCTALFFCWGSRTCSTSVLFNQEIFQKDERSILSYLVDVFGMLLYVLYIRIVDCVKPLYSSGNQVIKRIESAYILLGIPEPEFVNVKEPQE